MSGEQLRTQAEQELQAEAKADLEEVQLPKEQKEGVAKETQKKLDTIKKEIESGIFGMESLKTHLDALNEINNSDMKSIYLGSIITALNKKGFYVLGFNQKGINLAGGYQINGKTAPGEEVEGYETILNNYMKSGSFTKADFQKAMLYRSSEMKNFISQNTDSTGRLLNSPNVDQYAVQLLKKYPDLDQNIQKDPEGGLMYVEKDEKIYTNWKQAMREKIKENPEDADFLVSYFDSKFYGSKEKFAGNGSPFESYKSTSQEIKTKLDTFTNSFTNEELYSLGIRNPSELQQFKTSVSQDPVGTIGESIKKGFGIGILLGIIGLLFGGKKGFLVGFLGGTAIAGNSEIVKDLFTRGTEAVTSGTGTFLDRVSEKYKDIAGAFSDASPEQQNIAENLFKHEKFQKAPASILNIFNNPQFNTLDLQKTELAKYGIDLTEANKADYEAVFALLVAKRADANIHIQGSETVNDFFTKTNDVADTTGAAASTGSETPNVSQTPVVTSATRETLITQQTETLEIKEKSIEEIYTSLQNAFIDFTNATQKANEAGYFLSDEEKENLGKEINEKYIVLLSYIQAFDQRIITDTTFKKDGTENNEVSRIKLEISKYFSDLGTIDNDFLQNPIISLDLALQNLPDESKPKFPTTVDILKRLRGQTSLMSYITEEGTKGRNIQEILADTQVSEQFGEIQSQAYETYEQQLEQYILALEKNPNLTNIQIQSLNLIKDIQGIGTWNMKETTFQSSQKIGGSLLSAGAGMGTMAVGMAFCPGIGWVSGAALALASGLVTTVGTALVNRKDYISDTQDGAVELGINTVTFGVAGGAYKLATHLSKTGNGFTKTGIAIGEGGVDVGIGATGDYVRAKNQGVDISYSDALKQNLIWALAPIVFRGAAYTGERLNLAKTTANKVETADVLRASGDSAGADKVMSSVNDDVAKVRVEPNFGTSDKSTFMNVDNINLIQLRDKAIQDTKNLGDNDPIGETLAAIYKVSPTTKKGELIEEVIPNRIKQLEEQATTQKGANGKAEGDSEVPPSVNNAETAAAQVDEVVEAKKLGYFVDIKDKNYISNLVGNLETGKTISIGDLKIEKLSNGEYKVLKGEVEYKKNLSGVNKMVGEIDSSIRHKFVISQKEAAFLQSKIGIKHSIHGHTVVISDLGKLEVRAKDGRVLTGDELIQFKNAHIEEITKKFHGMSIGEAGVKVKDSFATGYEKLGIKTVLDYLDRAGYNKGSKSEFFSKQLPDYLGGIVLTPATTIRQLVSAIPKGEWENIVRILIGGNKNIPVFGKSGDGLWRIIDSGLGRAGAVGSLIYADDLFFDRDTSTSDEIGDYAFNMYGGILITSILKYSGAID